MRDRKIVAELQAEVQENDASTYGKSIELFCAPVRPDHPVKHQTPTR